MKYLLPLLILMFILTACMPVDSEAEVQTRVAQLLTSYPTTTAQSPVGQTPTNSLPTVDFTLNTLEPTSTESPTITVTIPPPTMTPDGTLTPFPTATSIILPSATSPAGDPRLGLGTASWRDPMDDDTYWATGATTFNNLSFSGGEMVLTGLNRQYGWRLATTESLQDFYMELSGRFGVCVGSDSYGIMFRIPDINTADRGYLFGITCDGNYFLRRWNARENAPTGTMTTIIIPRGNDAILIGPNQTNRLGVTALGNNLQLYVNGVMIHEILETTFTQGYFGVFIRAAETTNFTVFIDEMSYWYLQ